MPGRNIWASIKCWKGSAPPFEVMDGRKRSSGGKSDAHRVIILPGIKALPIKAAGAGKSGAVIIGTGLRWKGWGAP